MPLIESPPDALARMYAQSLFELAESEGGQERIEAILGELEAILEIARSEPRFGEFLSSRILPVRDRARSLDAIFEGRISPTTLRFLQVLNRKGRLSHLSPIVAALDKMVQNAFGRVEVDVFTPSPISTEQLNTLRDRLRDVLGREPVLHPYTDRAMLGGIKVRIGDQLLDGSLATRLNRMRDQLASHGLAQVRAQARRILGLDDPDGDGQVASNSSV